MNLTKRQIEILRLLRREVNYVTAEQIARELQVSTRTIYNDIRAISSSTDLAIERKSGVGIRLLSQEGFSPIEEVEEVTLRRIHILWRLLAEEAVVTYESLSEEFYVSKTSIERDFIFLAEDLLPGTLEFVHSAQGTYLRGGENRRQRAMIRWNDWVVEASSEKDTIEERCRIWGEYYGKELVKACREEAERLFSEEENRGHYYLQNGLSGLVVLVYRLGKGAHRSIEKEGHLLNEAMGLRPYFLAKESLDRLGRQLDFQAEEADVFGLSQQYQANRIGMTMGSSEDDDAMYQLALRLVSHLSRLVGEELETEEATLHMIALHLRYMIYRTKHGISIRNPLLREIKEEFRVMFDLTWLVLDAERAQFGEFISEDEIAFFTLHFQTLMDQNQKSRRILVVTEEQNVVSKKYLVNRLRRVLPPFDLLEPTSARKIAQYGVDNIDLLISMDMSVESDQPVVFVSPLLTESDLKAVQRGYQDILLKDEGKEELAERTLFDCFDPSLFFLQQQAQDREEVIDAVCAELVRQNVVYAKYGDSVRQREKQGGTELASGAAIPHGSVDAVKESRIAIWTNQTSLSWGSERVSLVVFFVLAKEDLRYIKEWLRLLYQKIGSKKWVRYLLSLSDSTEVMEAFQKGGEIDV